MWHCTSEVLLLTILAFFSVTSVSSFPNNGSHECSNCSEQFIKMIDAITGKCITCWPCPKCNDGYGSSVACPSTVTYGTDITCVLCIDGISFSDSIDTGQCRSCGTCQGEHEHVLHECTVESDVKCDCDAGFYRNKTTNDCLPCGSCSDCSNDDEIISKCQEEEGKDSEHPKPSSSTYSTVGDSEVGLTVVKSCSTVLATSSSLLMTSSYLHATKTPKLPLGFMVSMSLVPSRTQQIQATSAMTVLKWSKYEMTPTQSAAQVIYYQNIHKTVNTDILIAVLTVVCAFIFICVLGFLYRKFKKVRKRRMINQVQRKKIKFSELKQNEQRNPVFGEESSSRRSSDVDVPTGNAQEVSCQREDSLPDLSSTMNNSEDLNKTKDPVHGDRVLLNDQNTAVREAVQKGIPLSLDGGTKNPTSKGDQGDLTITSVVGKIVPSSNDQHSQNVSLQSKTPSAANNTVNVYLNFNPRNSEQISDHPQIHRAAHPPFAELTSHGNNVVIPASVSGVPVANQGAICGTSSIVTPAVQTSQGNRGYSTHITLVPFPVIQNICMLLDSEREIDGKDYRMLGSELGLSPLEIRSLKQQCMMSNTFKSPSHVLLMQVFSAKQDSGTLDHLIPILRKIGRHDVVQVLDKWVGSQNCQGTQVN